MRKAGALSQSSSNESRDWSFYLEEIVRQALRCKEITRGLLDLSRQRRPVRVPVRHNEMAARRADS